MSQEDTLLANLLSIATEELENLSKTSTSLKETNIFKQESNIEKSEVHNNLHSFVHKGDTDSSDDEDNRINENKKYNQLGREIKHLLKTSSSFGGKQKEKSSSWKTKISFAPSCSRIESKESLLPVNSSNVSKTSDVFTDPIFGIRIVNPLISSTTLKERMVGREAISFANINQYLQKCDKEKDWVIAGVITSKSAVKTSQKGTQFSIWTISDLKNDIKTISLFLFSSAYKQLWKTVVGSVIGVLNPNVLDKKDGSKDEACLSVDNPQKVLILGISKDFGTCKSIKKNGEPCTSIVNLNQCEYCIYHIKQEYQKCSKRSELQANFAGRGLTALRNKVLGKNEVFYAGKSYMAIPAKKSKKLEYKDNHRLQSLSGKSVGIISNNINKIKNTSKKENAARLDVSQAQRLRDMELLKKLGGCLGLETKTSFSGTHSVNISLEESKNIATNVIGKLKSKNSVNNVDNKETSFTTTELDYRSIVGNNENITKNINPLQRNNSPVSADCYTSLNNSMDNAISNCFSSSTINKSLSLENITNVNKPIHLNDERSTFSILPSSGSFLDLNKPITSKQKDRAKLNAIKFVQRNGGIKKTDPNSTRGTCKKRGIEIEKTENTPKKSKLAQSEFISDRFKKMMETTSQHLDLLEYREDEEKDKYFKKLEIKEKMEEKMINTHKVSCKAVRCLKCKYTSFSASDLCKSEKHALKVFDTTKRFFKCGDCGNRTVTLGIIPVEPCKNCGSGKWQKSGMMKDKTVVTHSLSIRGGEQKFVNSVVTDANVDLLVPNADD